MIAVDLFRNERIAILGLARSGLAAAHALTAGGATVLAWDDSAPARERAAENGIALTDLATADLAGVRALVLSPGIPHSFPKPHPVTARARAAGVEIIGDIELLARSRGAARYVGITGTNGKSTTTALIGHILAAAGRGAQVGGNLGIAALLLDALESDGYYVLEMSSYQLELTHNLTFDVAVLLNITPDHLDRHGGMEGYIAAKERIFRQQGAAQAAVIGIDDPISAGIAATLAKAGHQRIVPISVERRTPGGVHVADGRLIDELDGAPRAVLDLTTAPRLPGKHNWQNAAAAYAAVRCLGVASDDAVAAIRNFPGLAHRQELIAELNGVRFINDSKATNADATAKALACYDAIHWIVGGVPKAGGIADLSPFFWRIRHAYLIGQAADEFGETLAGRVTATHCSNLAIAVAAAAADARPGSVVLLSPACASFDQFSDFEARGEAFRRLVQGLAGAAR